MVSEDFTSLRLIFWFVRWVIEKNTCLDIKIIKGNRLELLKIVLSINFELNDKKLLKNIL